jgi:protein-L-isoaspartate(D-aspartate) O-methyltransferase
MHFFILMLSFGIFTTLWQQQDPYRLKRVQMVDKQLRGRGINDQQVLEAMRKVERHLFVPVEQIDRAYMDRPLPIGHGQTISQPYIVAFMTEALNLKPQDRVLEIGTGSGYQAAILGEICAEVFSIEIVEPLGLQAKITLDELGYENISIKIGDGYKGWRDEAPFDAIIVTCAPTNVPQPLVDQLAEGGSMIIPAGTSDDQKLYLLRKEQGALITRDVLNVRFVPMVDQEGNKYED